MGFFESIIKGASNAAGIGSSSLRDAADPAKTSNKPGVYLLIVNGDVKKAGSAEIGIQKRMQQYYNLNTACGLNRHINSGNRDSIRVKWQYCTSRQCEELESKLNDKYQRSHRMEWSERRPRSDANTVQLKI